jgi:hypothetical protein
MAEKKVRRKKVTKQKQKQSVIVNVNSNNKKRITRGVTTPSKFSPITIAPSIIMPPPQQHPNENNTMNNMLRELQNEIQNLKIHHPLKAPLIQQQGIEVAKILNSRGNQTIMDENPDIVMRETPLTTEINTQTNNPVSIIGTQTNNPVSIIGTQTNNPVSVIGTQTNNPVSSIETQTERQQVKRALNQIEYQNTPPIVTFPDDSPGPSSPRTPFFNPTISNLPQVSRVNSTSSINQAEPTENQIELSTNQAEASTSNYPPLTIVTVKKYNKRPPQSLSRINSFGSTQIPLYGNGQSQLTSQNIPSTSALAIVNPPNFGYGNPLVELYKNDKRISKEMRLEKKREVLPTLLNSYPPIILDRKIIEEVKRIEKGKRARYLTNE